MLYSVTFSSLCGKQNLQTVISWRLYACFCHLVLITEAKDGVIFGLSTLGFGGLGSVSASHNVA